MPVWCMALVPLPQASLTSRTRMPRAIASRTVAAMQASVHTPATISQSVRASRSKGASSPSLKALASFL